MGGGGLGVSRGVKLLQAGEMFLWKSRESFEDARNLVETATLAGAVIGSGKRFQSKESRNEENIPD